MECVGQCNEFGPETAFGYGAPPMSVSYQGAVAVVTGGASGIGRATALAMARRGGVVRTVNAFLPHLIERGSGYIVLTSSIGGLAASTIGAPYVTTKHAVVGFGESLSMYLRPKGIGVSVLCPGGVATNIFENLRKA